MKISNIQSTAHHHQTLGTVERSHLTFNEYVRSYISIDKDDWYIWLNYFTYCFNTTPSTVHEYCPYELIFGRSPRLFIEFNNSNKIDPIYNIEDNSKEFKFRLEVARNRARTLIEKEKQKRKLDYDKTNRDVELKVGSLVLLKNETGHKLEPKNLGSFEVIRIEENNNIVIRNKKNKEQKVQRDRLKIYYQ